jgi:hypothetical protein
MILLRKIRQRVDQRLVLFILNLLVNIIWLLQDDRVIQYASLIVVLFSNFLTAGGWPALKVVLNPIQARRPLLILASLAAPFVLLLVKCGVVGLAWFDDAFPLDPSVAIIDALSSLIIVVSLDEKISPATALRDLAYVAYAKVTKLLLDKVEKPGEFIVVNKLNRPALVNPIGAITPPPEGSVEKNKKLRDCLKEADYRLLVLGRPGAGKTTALYELAASLLDELPDVYRVDRNAALKYSKEEIGDTPPGLIPIILDLTSWARRREPLETWLVNELHFQGIGRQISYPLLRGTGGASPILLLLDGLDEMKNDAMRQCLIEINEFLNSTDTAITRPAVVVTCRNDEYLALQMDDQLRLKLNNAVELQPLEAPQIEGYLSRKRANFALHPDYLEVLSNPLMLYAVVRVAEKDPGIVEEMRVDAVVTVPVAAADQTAPVDPVAAPVTMRPLTKEEKEDRIFTRYIDHAIEEYGQLRTTGKDKNAPQLVRGQLAWLARHMTDEKFLIDDIQPGWLRSASLERRRDFGFIGWLLVYLFASRTILALIVALAAGLILAAPTENFLAGLYTAIFVTLFDVLRFALARRRTRRGRAAGGGGTQVSGRARLVRAAIGFLVVFFGSCVILSLHFGLDDLNASSAPPMDIAGVRLDILGVTHGVYLALFLAAYLGVGRSDQTLTTDVGTIDELSPAWGSAILRGLVWGIVGGLVIGMAAMLLFYAPANQQTSVWLHRVSGDLPLGDTPLGWFSIGGGVGLLIGFVFGLMFGSFRVAPLERQRIANPDRSLGMSVRYAIVLALIFGTLFSVLFGVIFFSITYNYISILKGVLLGLAIGILTAPYYGGIALINLTVLRTILYIRGLPFRLLARLDTLKKTTLIQRRDRGYVFYHKRVFEYFKEREQQIVHERLHWSRLGRALIYCAIPVVLVLAVWFARSWIYSYDIPSGATFVTFNNGYPTSSPYYVQAGEEVQLRSKGLFRAGLYVGFVTPDGTEVGFLGLPVTDVYDIVPALPHSALMCRVQGEHAWSPCAYTDSVLPFAWRSATFRAPQAGCLEFAINEKEHAGHAGGYWVLPEPDKMDPSAFAPGPGAQPACSTVGQR